MRIQRRPASIRIEGWGWRHSGRRDWALRGVDLTIAPSERVLLLGPSGAGKSTLLMAMAGLLDPSSAADTEGRIMLDGQPVHQVRERTGLLQQDPETSLIMSRAGDDVAFGLENRGVPREQIWPIVDDTLHLVGFPYDRQRLTQELSGGEQQRLALAGVLAAAPGILLLDEPTANLDPAGGALVRSTLERVLEETGATMVLVEHRVADAMPIVDRVVVLEPGGGVVADGAPAAVFSARGEDLAARGVWVPNRPPRAPGPSRAPAGPVAMTATDVRLTYPGASDPILDAVSMTLRAGQMTALTGPNGAGKSTLAMVLAGLIVPDGGGVHVSGCDRPLHRWPARALCRRVGTVFQDPEHQFLTSRVAEELRPRQGPQHDAARADELLHRLRLDHLRGANPFTLSGGEKRRLSVATALVAAPSVLVLDEPTFGQDALTWAELAQLCAELRDAGGALLAATHDGAFSDGLADRRLRVAAGGVEVAP